MNQEHNQTRSTSAQLPTTVRLSNSYYGLLGLHPSASFLEIRTKYRELSKLYHPDTTELPVEVATQKFQQLNEAYGALSNPHLRTLYDAKIGYARTTVIQAPLELDGPTPQQGLSRSAYLEATERPLSPGELFVLFILGLTFVGCLLIAIAIGLSRGESSFQVANLLF